MATGYSCEPTRKTAYSEDLRWRMVWQREVLGLTLERVASNLNVDVSTVHRTVKKFRESGSVSKKAYSSEVRLEKLTRPVQFTILFQITASKYLFMGVTTRAKIPLQIS